ncbi:MAG: hypothetical protein ABIF11_05775 [Nitrospirota bacterium]
MLWLNSCFKLERLRTEGWGVMPFIGWGEETIQGCNEGKWRNWETGIL